MLIKATSKTCGNTPKAVVAKLKKHRRSSLVQAKSAAMTKSKIRLEEWSIYLMKLQKIKLNSLRFAADEERINCKQLNTECLCAAVCIRDQYRLSSRESRPSLSGTAQNFAHRPPAWLAWTSEKFRRAFNPSRTLGALPRGTSSCFKSSITLSSLRVLPAEAQSCRGVKFRLFVLRTCTDNP